jgi:hypothetical protein
MRSKRISWLGRDGVVLRVPAGVRRAAGIQAVSAATPITVTMTPTATMTASSVTGPNP